MVAATKTNVFIYVPQSLFFFCYEKLTNIIQMKVQSLPQLKATMRDFERKKAKNEHTNKQTEKHKHLNNINKLKLIFRSTKVTIKNKVGR